MIELRAFLEIAAVLNTPMLAAIGWLVWRIYNNHLPHIEVRLEELAERTSFIEGTLKKHDKWERATKHRA